MKKKFGSIFAAFTLSAVLCLGAACGETIPPDGGDPVDSNNPGGTQTEETYTITFTDRGEVVASYEEKRGDKVTVPGAPDREDSRYTFTGWEGLSEDATEVIVYGNATYDANWWEMFGSETVFTAMERNTTKSIAFDGNDDDEAWADAEEYDLDGNGSTAKFLWDEDGIYIFANVVKAGATKDADTLGVLIDLLHSEALASDTWDGQGWGGVYRGEPGPMVEGGYTIKAGATSDSDIDKSWEWLAAGDNDRNISSVISDDGYTVEFKIGTTNTNIGDYKPHAGQKIGLSVKTGDGASVLETFEGYAGHGPKSLSNVLLVKNTDNIDFLWSVKEVRENYDVKVDGEGDILYKDASVFTVGEDGTTVKALWHNSGKIYLLANLGSSTTSLKVEAFGGSVEFTASGEKELVASEAFDVEDWGAFTLTVNGVATESYIRLVRNPENFGRHLYEAKKLAAGASITVDGELDAAYGAQVATVDTPFQGAPSATGAVYIRWDDEYLYVFVAVTDSSVCTEKHHGDPWQNDSVELSIDTCRTLANTTQGYGSDNRPYGDYEGEGHFRVNSYGDYSYQGWIWMGDDSDNVFGPASGEKRPEGTAAKITDTGYNVEFRMKWMSFGAVEDKVGEIINFMININDNNNHTDEREGVMSLNRKGGESWQWAGVLDQLKLVAAD